MGETKTYTSDEVSRILARWCDCEVGEFDYLYGDSLAVPVVPNLDATILQAVRKPGNELDMGDWHSCDTVHCLAGWAVVVAGEPGLGLEKQLEGDTQLAGALIYYASTGHVPDFFQEDSDLALELLEERAIEAAGA